MYQAIDLTKSCDFVRNVGINTGLLNEGDIVNIPFINEVRILNERVKDVTITKLLVKVNGEERFIPLITLIKMQFVDNVMSFLSLYCNKTITVKYPKYYNSVKGIKSVSLPDEDHRVEYTDSNRSTIRSFIVNGELAYINESAVKDIDDPILFNTWLKVRSIFYSCKY